MSEVITLSRLIQVFIVFFGGGTALLVFSYLILKRDRDNVHLVFTGFFFSIFVAGLLNVIYVLLTPIVSEIIVMSLHLLTYCFFCLALLFLLIFNLIILKSEQIITVKKQIIMILIFIGLLSIFFLIPEGAQINAETHYRPQWNLPLFLYATIFSFIVLIFPNLYTSFLIYKKIEVPEIRKRWKFYIIGIFIEQIEHIGVGVMIFLNNPELRAWWNIYDIITLLGLVFLYYGVGKQL